MNAPRKNSAVKKYESLINNGGTVEDLKLALSGDEKAYTPEEIDEIVKAITDTATAPKDPPKPPAPKEDKKELKKPEEKKALKKEVEKTGYEEWRMEWAGEKLEKLKKLRDNVKISEAEAETLNAGASAKGSYNPIMYIKPE